MTFIADRIKGAKTGFNEVTSFVKFDSPEELSPFEGLHLVENLNQLLVPHNSPCKHWSLVDLKKFVAQYHACIKVTSFLIEWGISSPSSGFGRLLPSVVYERKDPCRYCGCFKYVRGVATHSDLYHKRHGDLSCMGCDTYIVLTPGDDFGEEYSWTFNPPICKWKSVAGPSRGVALSALGELQPLEQLQLVDSLEQMVIPKDSPCIDWTLAEHKQFIAEYHSCPKVAIYLIEKGINIPPNHFGRLLPRVRYDRSTPCRYCGGHTYTRRVSTRGDIMLKLGGHLACDGCDAWINLNKGGDYYGDEWSSQIDPSLARPNLPKVSASPCSQTIIDPQFLNALFERYIPEYQHNALSEYFSGLLTLEQIQERTGIFI